MAFGVKVKTLKTEKIYTIESLFEAIQGQTFTAGVPSLAKHGPTTLIVFPALDSQNQVQISRLGFKAETQKFNVQKAQEAGLKNMAANAAIDSLTGGVFGMRAVVGKNAKLCEELVEATAKELEALGL